MASEGGCKKTAAIFEDDDYLTLDRLLLSLTKDVTFSDGSFTLCMWIYLVKSSKGNIIINQVQGSGEAAFPFLTLECERKLSLFPAMLFKLDIDGALDASIDKLSVTAELPCSLDKWVHVGCEEIKSVELVEPTGWTYISLCPSESREAFVQTFMLQLAVLANHQNGRDTHIRQVKVYGPYPSSCKAMVGKKRLCYKNTKKKLSFSCVHAFTMYSERPVGYYIGRNGLHFNRLGF